MTIDEIIEGLRFTVDMFLLDPMSGETKMPANLNKDDKTTVDACMEAIKILKRYRWVPVKERMPDYGEWVEISTSEESRNVHLARRQNNELCYEWKLANGKWLPIYYSVLAWKPLPESYKTQNEEE